ncbi:hypothetical protein HKX48_004872 [Thoreauomyces humboldtii]|nr:hypothetical protein HKX48_004872 [Thoreauomyces humboldtii]
MAVSSLTSIVPVASDVGYLRLPVGFSPPSKKFVGLLAAQNDPMLRTIETVVVRVEKRQPAIVQAAKAAKGKKAHKKIADLPVSSEPAVVEWEIEFEDTVLFPEGGGQPADQGTATLFPSAKSIKIENVIRRDLDAIHFISLPPDADPSTEGWAPGSRVRLDLDWERRRDHMQQHTGQHLISGIFEQELGILTHGWSLTATGACYVDFLTPPTQEQIEHVSRRCRDLIAENRRITVDIRLDSERPGSMPTDYQEGVVRYVEIENLEVNPCCGTHAPTLSFLNAVHIFPGYQTISAPARSRVFFVVGDRVLLSLASYHQTAKAAAMHLGCGIDELASRVDKLLVARREDKRREKVLRADAVRALASDLTSAMKDSHGIMAATLHRAEESTDIDFLVAVLQEFKPPVDTEGTPVPWLVILSGGEIISESSSASPGGCLLMSGSSDVTIMKAGDLLKISLGHKLKGGGKGRWQGKLTGGWFRSDLVRLDQVLNDATW